MGLFKTAGYSIAMGNAINELKEIADEITESNDHDGVAIITDICEPISPFSLI